MPADADARVLVGRYIPNLVPRLFTLDRDFIQEIRDLVPAEPLDEILADYDTWIARAAKGSRPPGGHRTARLAVRQPGALDRDPGPAVHRRGRRRCGCRALRRDRCAFRADGRRAGHQHPEAARIRLQHSRSAQRRARRRRAVRDRRGPEPRSRRPSRSPPNLPASRPRVEAAPAAAPAAAPGAPRPDDIPFDAADATLALIALSAKMRVDQIEPLDSIESITDGASSRRNQLLVDLGSELNLGAIDGAAEADLTALRGQVTKLARTYKPFGPVLTDAVNDQLRTVLGPSGKRPGAIAERVTKTWELGEGWAKHVTVELALGTREGSSVRGGAAGWSARRCADRCRRRGQGHRRRGGRRRRPARHRGGAAVHRRRRPVAWSTPPRSTSSPRRSPAATACSPRRPGWCSAQLGLDSPVSAAASSHRHRTDRPGHRRTRRRLAAPGGPGVRRPKGGAARRPVGQCP